ncbi:MAG: XRE family transcriptional regulator [Lachnospiraceae bacterium]|nr:XRE family transcriptional regulator [Lachnospiraceae bacterium]
MDYLSRNISLNLKRIRRSKGMSLDAVAEQTGVSKSMLSQIEKGSANPSIGVLGKIISGLRIELNELIDPPPLDSCLVHIPELEPTKSVPGQYRVWTCFPFQDNHHVEIYRIELEPGGAYAAGSHGERTREYLSVLEGTMEIVLQDGRYTVSKDDVFRFESDQEHIYRNASGIPCAIMCFFEEYAREKV